jgi:tetratricopeptide (TPR) repeat protein
MRGVTIACMVVCSPAWADTAAARSFFESGSVSFALGEFAAAANDYERAFSEKPDPALLYNAAQAHRLAGNTRRALLLYRSYLSTPLFTDRPAARQVARRISELEDALAGEEAAVHAEPTETTAWNDNPAPPPAPPAVANDERLPPLTLVGLLPLGMLLGGIWGRRRARTMMPPLAMAPPPPPADDEEPPSVARKTLLLELG